MELIETGGYGSIYRKITAESKKAIAIKKMTLEHDVPFFATLKEVNTLRVFKHPNIVEFQKVKVIYPQRRSTKTKSYFVQVEMDYWDTDLHRLMKRAYPKGLSLEDSLKVLSQIMSGIIFLHNNGIYHLDLKPANILVKLKNSTDIIERIAICDFGCGTYHHFDGVINIGTVNCRPPENFVNDAKGSLLKKINDAAGEGCVYSSETDIWACGALLIFLLTGKNLLYPEGDFSYSFPEARLCQFMNDYKKYISHFLDSVKLTVNDRTRVLSLLNELLDPNPKQRPQLNMVKSNALFEKYQRYFEEKGHLFRPLYTDVKITDGTQVSSFRDLIKKALPFLCSSQCEYKVGATSLDVAIRFFILKKSFDLLDLAASIRIGFVFFEDHEENAFEFCKQFSPNIIDIRCLYILDLLKGYLAIKTPFDKCTSIEDFNSLMDAYFKIKEYFTWTAVTDKEKKEKKGKLTGKWVDIFEKSNVSLIPSPSAEMLRYGFKPTIKM